MRGDRARVSRTTKRAAIVVAAVALIFGAAGSLFGAPQAGLAALKRQYWRPAAIPFPKDNPYGRAKEVLGRALFFDPILSGARVRSCATCHNPGLAWGDGEPRAIGENQVRLPLRSPTLFNIAWVPRLGWDGHFHDLESVAMGPITGQTNMNLPEQEMIDRLSETVGRAGRVLERADGQAASLRAQQWSRRRLPVLPDRGRPLGRDLRGCHRERRQAEA